MMELPVATGDAGHLALSLGQPHHHHQAAYYSYDSTTASAFEDDHLELSLSLALPLPTSATSDGVTQPNRQAGSGPGHPNEHQQLYHVASVSSSENGSVGSTCSPRHSPVFCPGYTNSHWSIRASSQGSEHAFGERDEGHACAGRSSSSGDINLTSADSDALHGEEETLGRTTEAESQKRWPLDPGVRAKVELLRLLWAELESRRRSGRIAANLALPECSLKRRMPPRGLSQMLCGSGEQAAWVPLLFRKQFTGNTVTAVSQSSVLCKRKGPGSWAAPHGPIMANPAEPFSAVYKKSRGARKGGRS